MFDEMLETWTEKEFKFDLKNDYNYTSQIIKN